MLFVFFLDCRTWPAVWFGWWMLWTYFENICYSLVFFPKFHLSRYLGWRHYSGAFNKTRHKLPWVQPPALSQSDALVSSIIRDHFTDTQKECVFAFGLNLCQKDRYIFHAIIHGSFGIPPLRSVFGALCLGIQSYPIHKPCSETCSRIMGRSWAEGFVRICNLRKWMNMRTWMKHHV